MTISIYNWLKDSGNVSTSFDSWVAAQGTTPKSLSIGSDVTITGNLTLPSTIDIVTFTNNAKFTGSGKTLTINKMSAQPRHQIFDTGLNVVFGPNAVSYILPDWFGSGNGNIFIGSGVSTPLSKVYVEGGMSIGTNLAAGSGNLYVAGSGAFTGVVHGATPTVDTHLTTKLYTDTASGALSTRINNSGSYSANISGQLSTRIDNKVPYTGASGNVNLGTNYLTTDKIYLNPNPTVGAHQSGKLYYDLTWDTLSANIGRDVTLQIGQEELRRVYNNSSGTILNGQAVYTNGTYNSGPNDVATVALACANNMNTYWVLGLATQNIASGQYGMITVRGHINDVDTSSFNNGDVLYLSDTSSGNLTTALPSPGNYKVRVGRVITANVSGRINVRLLAAGKLGDLANVTAPTPALDDVLRFNGTEWVNGAPVTSSASVGIEFFMDDTTIVPTGVANSNKIMTLSKTPVTSTPEDVDTISVTAATSPAFGEAYLYNSALGRTLLDGGVWTFNTYASVNSTLAGRISSIKRSLYAVIVSSGTLSTSGTGTTRTAYSYNSSPFLSGDVGADKTYASYIQTPTGLYQISGYLNTTSSTLIVPSTYVNETGVAYSKWKYLFQSQTPTITSLNTNYALYNTDVAASGIAINTTDKLGEIIFGISNNTTSIYFTHNGTDHYSHFETPLITLHNNLAGLQGGNGTEMYHLSAAQYSGLSSGGSVGPGTSGYVPMFLSTSGIGDSIIRDTRDGYVSVTYNGLTAFRLNNTAPSDANGQRGCYIDFVGKRASGDVVGQANITVGHDSADNDDKSRLSISVNNGTTGTTERLRITSSGYLGLNTTTPLNLLSVSGDIDASGYKIVNKNIITNNIVGKSHYLWTYPTADGALKVTNYSGSADLVTVTNSGNLQLNSYSSGILYSDSVGLIRTSAGFNGTVTFVE